MNASPVGPDTAKSASRAVGVIPARWESTRFPGKSLATIAGKPLIVRVVERVRQCTSLAEILVATDDERIVSAVAGTGARAVMTRSDHPSGTDRVAEAVRKVSADIVVNVQGDEPLIDPSLIDRLVACLRAAATWDMATAATSIRDATMLDNPSVVKVVCGAEGRALYFSRSVIPHIRDRGNVDATDMHWRHLGVYAYRRPFLERLVAASPSRLELAECLEQLRALHLGAAICVLETADRGIGVDTPADVQYVERVIREEGPEHGSS